MVHVSSWSFNMNDVDNSENEQLQLAVESQFEELECDDAEDAGSIDSEFHSDTGLEQVDINPSYHSEAQASASTAPSDISQSIGVGTRGARGAAAPLKLM